jgi:Rrf2 family protein
MVLTKKTKYAIRALVELAKSRGKGPVKIADIANAQRIPQRFLEVILSQLKASGFVESKRGYYGGYSLVQSPENITINEVYQFIQKPIGSNLCVGCESQEACPFQDECVFFPLWKKVLTSVSNIYEQTTIQDLILGKLDN